MRTKVDPHLHNSGDQTSSKRSMTPFPGPKGWRDVTLSGRGGHLLPDDRQVNGRSTTQLMRMWNSKSPSMTTSLIVDLAGTMLNKAMMYTIVIGVSAKRPPMSLWRTCAMIRTSNFGPTSNTKTTSPTAQSD